MSAEVSGVPAPTLPFGIRAIEALDPLLRALGRGTMDPHRLRRRAEAATGLSDWEGFEDAGLELYCQEVRQLPVLLYGRLHLEEFLVGALGTWLRLVEARRSPLPALGPPPLIVCGLPRSGTTLLHRLLCEGDGMRPIPLWELAEPLPGPGRDRRLAKAEARQRQLNRVLGSALDAQHLVRPELPDECSHLFKPTLRAAMYWRAPATGWLDWMLEADGCPAYAAYRDLLALLPREDGQRFALKDPFHALWLPELFAAIPDAQVIVTHRDPLETVPSFHKLTLTVQRAFAPAAPVAPVVAANTEWLGRLADRLVAPRAPLPEDQVWHVSYRQLLADPVETAMEILTRAGAAPAGVRARVQARLAEHGQRRFGDNPYQVEGFGQTEAALAARFAGYRERFHLVDGG